MKGRLAFVLPLLVAGCVEPPPRMDRLSYDVAPAPSPYALRPAVPVTATPLGPPGMDAPTPLEPGAPPLVPDGGTLTILGPGDIPPVDAPPPAPPPPSSPEDVPPVPPSADLPGAPAAEGPSRDPVEQLLLKPAPGPAAPPPTSLAPPAGQGANTDVPMMGFRPMRGQKPTTP